MTNIESIKIKSKVVKLHKSVKSPILTSKNVLTNSPWDFVELWMKKEKHKTALFYWKQAKEFHDDSALQCLHKLMPEITANTSIVLEFNDKYDTKEHCNKQLVDLPFALQALGVLMDERFAYENQLIEELHEAHSEHSA